MYRLRSTTMNEKVAYSKRLFLDSIKNDVCYICHDKGCEFLHSCCASSVHYNCKFQYLNHNKL